MITKRMEWWIDWSKRKTGRLKTGEEFLLSFTEAIKYYDKFGMN